MATSLEEEVVQKLKKAQYLLYTVESCTGGLVSHSITNVSGASEVYFGGSIVYDNAAKCELGVSETTLLQHGAVSSEVAFALAESGLRKLQSNPFKKTSFTLAGSKGLVCVATTGIAGPLGGGKDKPVGLCYIAVAKSGSPTRVERFQIRSPKDRLDNKVQFANKALELLLEIL